MASLKVVLRKKHNKDGTFPLAIRITKDRKSSYIHLGHHLNPSEWDSVRQIVKKSHPNATRLNNLILKKKAEANDTMIDMQTRSKDVSSSAVRKQIKPKKGTSFFGQAEVFIENMRKAGKYNRVKPDLSRIKCFQDFLINLGNQDITFEEITVPLLSQYRAYLKGQKGSSERTIINHLLIIRTIYNQAVNSEIIDKKSYPFGKNKISIKIPDSLKIGISQEDLRALEEISLTGFADHARNVWLFSFYTAGMRISDVLLLKWADVRNDRLHYVMGKNNKGGSLKLSDKALVILNKYHYQEQRHDLIFPELKILDNLSDLYEVQRKTSYAIKQLNKYVARAATEAGITKKITMHISRHSFAQIAADKISVQILQKLYRHSNITTTIGYQSHFSTKPLDDALDAVLKF